MPGHKRIAHFILFSLLLSSCREKKEEVFNNTIAVKIVNAQEKFLDNELSSFGTISYKLKNDITALKNVSLAAGASKDVVVLFQVKESDASSVAGSSMTATSSGTSLGSLTIN